MIGKFLESVIGGDEKVEIDSLSEADEAFREKRSERIQRVRNRSEELSQKVLDDLDTLEQDIEELEEFRDEKGRDIVDDVVSNVAEDRRKLIDGFEDREDPVELYDQLDEFQEEFRSMTRKEAAVMEEAFLKDKFSDSLGSLEKTQEEIAELLENDHETLRRYRELSRKLEERKEVADEKEKVEKEIDQLDVTEKEEELEEARSELGELEEDELREEFENLEENLEQAENQKEKIQKDIGRAMSKMERGLKKILYEGSISGLSRQGSEILREIRDQAKDEILERKPSKVEKAVKTLRESDKEEILDDSTRKNLNEGAEELEMIVEKSEKIRELTDRISELEEKIEEHSYGREKKRLEDRIESVERELEKRKDRRKELRQRLDDLNSEKENHEEDIVDILDTEFGEVEIGEH